jgi:hypothetical protein
MMRYAQVLLFKGKAMNRSFKLINTILVVVVLIASLTQVSTAMAVVESVCVTKIVLLDSNPTDAEMVRYLVYFSHPVIDVDLRDFWLTIKGDITGAEIRGIYGSGNTRTVSVFTGSGDGKIRLDVLNNGTIQSGGLFLEKPFSGGPFYTIEKGPAVPTATLPDQNPTSAESVSFMITFPDEVGSIAVTDFVPVIKEGLQDAAVTAVEGSGKVYTVTVSTGYGEGKLSLAFAEDNQIKDPSGEPLGYSSLVADFYFIERPNPYVTKIKLMDDNPTSSSEVNFLVVFSRPVIGVSIIDFTLTVTEDLTDVVVSSVSGSEETYLVSVDTGTGNGTIRLDVVDNDTIEDLDGNTFDAPYTSGEPYEIKREVLDVTIKAEEEQKEDGDYVFEVTFSKPVTGFDEKSVVISGLPESAIVKVSGSGAVYSITVSGLIGDEKISLDLIPSAFRDDQGNSVELDFTSEIFDMEMIQKVIAPLGWSTQLGGSLLWVFVLVGGVAVAAGFFLLRRKKAA